MHTHSQWPDTTLPLLEEDFDPDEGDFHHLYGKTVVEADLF